MHGIKEFLFQEKTLLPFFTQFLGNMSAVKMC